MSSATLPAALPMHHVARTSLSHLCSVSRHVRGLLQDPSIIGGLLWPNMIQREETFIWPHASAITGAMSDESAIQHMKWQTNSIRRNSQRKEVFVYLPFGTGDLTNPPGLLPLGIVVLIYHMNWLPTCVQSVWKFLAVALSLKTGISEEIGFLHN